MQVSSTVWFHSPAGWCACSDSTVGSRLDCHKLQWIYLNVNGHQTRRTLTLLLRLGSYAWTLRDILSQAKEHWWTEESHAVNMGPAASGFNQQDHTELHKNTSIVCERWDRHLERVLRKTTDAEHWTLQVTVHFFHIILKCGITYSQRCNSWSNENISVKFSGIVYTSFCYKSWNFSKKISIGCREIAFCQVGHFFEPPGIWTTHCMLLLYKHTNSKHYEEERHCTGSNIRITIQQWTLQVTVHFFGVILKCGITYSQNCNSWSNENI